MSSPAPLPPTPPQYEFSEHDNHTLTALARSMRGVGFFFMLLGVMYLIVAILTVVNAFRLEIQAALNWAAVIMLVCTAVIWIYIGSGTRAAGAHFQQIVATSQNDIAHLMAALVRLRGVYGLIYALILLLVLMSLFVLIVQVFGLMGPANPVLRS
jgi:hypothetical protein